MNQSRASPAAGLEGAGLLELVGCAGHYRQVVLAAQLRLGPAVEVQHHLVTPADDEQRWCGHGRKPGRARSGRPLRDTTAAMPAPGSAAAHSAAAAPGAGSEIADGGLCRARLGAQPSGDLEPGEQADVEHVGPVEFLLGGEQVAKERARAGMVQDAGDIPVAGLCLLLPLPWAKTTIPRGFSGTARYPARRTKPAWGSTSSLRARGSAGPAARVVLACAGDCGVAARPAPPPAPGRSGRRPGPWTRWRCRRRPPPRPARPAAGAAAGPGNAQPGLPPQPAPAPGPPRARSPAPRPRG